MAKIRPGMTVRHGSQFAIVQDVSSTMAWVQFLDKVTGKAMPHVWPVSKFQLRRAS